MKQTAPYTIIYEDDCIIAVNKASGIAVGGDRWDDAKERLDTLIGEGYGRIFTVHRIDRDTSGLVLFTRDEGTHKKLSMAFENRQVQKRYIAVVHGRVSWAETNCDLPLVPNGDKLHRTIIDKYRGKKSLTRFRLVGSAGNYSVIEALPETGRTHQIRVHLAALGHPIVCDPLYGKSAGRSIEKGVLLSSFKKGWRGDPLDEQPLLDRLGLHAAALTLPDFEQTAETVSADSVSAMHSGGRSFSAPLSRDISALLKQMEKSSGNAFADLWTDSSHSE